MLRLAPSHVPLWRSPTSVQFGADAVVRVDDIAPWQERLLDALVDGIPDAMAIPLAENLGADRDAAERFLERIRPALVDGSPRPPRVALELPEKLSHEEGATFARALFSSGLDVDVRRWSHDGHRVPVVVVAHRLLDPRRVAQLIRADIVHLPVELSGDRVTVGPLVVPGRTACEACRHAHRRDADSAWPVIAAQLLSRAPTPTDPALLQESALLAARMLRGASPVEPPDGRQHDVSHSVSVSSSSVRRTWRAHRPHAECLCRSPEGTASAAALDAPLPEPTTATVFARPA